MEWLNANVWIFGLMCVLGLSVIVYGIWAGREIGKRQNPPDMEPEIDSEDDATSSSRPPVAPREARGTTQTESAEDAHDAERLLEELRETRGSVRHLQETLDRRAEKDVEERQRFALRLARLVIDAELEKVYDTESAAPPRDRPESGQATSEEPSSGESASHRREPAKPEPVPEESESRRVVRPETKSTPPGA